MTPYHLFIDVLSDLIEVKQYLLWCIFCMENNFDGEIELQRERFTFDGEREPLMGEVEFDVRGGG